MSMNYLSLIINESTFYLKNIVIYVSMDANIVKMLFYILKRV